MSTKTFGSQHLSAIKGCDGAIGDDADAASKWTIEWLHTPDVPVAALHGLAFEEVGGGATVRVVIFRWLVWRVHFPMLEPPTERTHYSRYLETGDEDANLGHIVGRR